MKMTKVKCVKLPDDINSALSYLADNGDKLKASHYIRQALNMRYKIVEPEVFKAETNYTKNLADAYFFHIPQTLSDKMKEEKSLTGMSEQTIIVSSIRRIINFY